MSRHTRNPFRKSLEQGPEQGQHEGLDVPGQPRHTAPKQKKDQNVNSTFRVRNLLDIPSGSRHSRHGSIAGIGVGVTPSAGRGHAVRRSAERVPSSPLRLSLSASSSSDAEDLSSADSGQARRSSDGTELAINKTEQPVDKPQELDVHQNYPFDMRLDDANTGLQRRPTEKSKAGQNGWSMGISGLELRALPSFARGRDSVRRSSARGVSLEPRLHSNFGRSLSPINRWFNAKPFGLTSKPGKAAAEKGRSIVMDNAQTHPSDDVSPGSLEVDPGAHGDGRLREDSYDGESNPLGSSEEETGEVASSDDDTAVSGSAKRSEGIESAAESSETEASQVPSESRSIPAAGSEEERTF